MTLTPSGPCLRPLKVAAAEGMQRIRGPFSLSINDECGLLVEGFDSPPPIMLGHALPYYQLRVEEQGYCQRAGPAGLPCSS